MLTLMPFAIMASLTVVLVVLWDRSPYVAVVLAGPLLATAIYQRWIHGALDRLREFDRLKDEFIAIVSHELRTPLTSVYGAAVTLRNRELDDTRRNLLLDIVSTESARLGRLLDDVLWVSRLDSGGAEPFITRVEPRELVSDVVDATRTHLPPGLSLDFRFDSASLPVAADPDRLRQVLVNLIENAVKYSGQGRIEVRVEPQYETTRFSVRDEGRGIPTDEAERIFEKFYRLDPNMTEGVGEQVWVCTSAASSSRGCRDKSGSTRSWAKARRSFSSFLSSHGADPPPRGAGCESGVPIKSGPRKVQPKEQSTCISAVGSFSSVSRPRSLSFQPSVAAGSGSTGRSRLRTPLFALGALLTSRDTCRSPL